MNVLTLQSVLVVILNDMPFIMVLFNNVLIAIVGKVENSMLTDCLAACAHLTITMWNMVILV